VTKDRASAAYRRTYIPMHTSRTNINVNVIPTTCRYCMFNVRQNSTRFTNYAGVVRTFEPRRKGGESEKGKGSSYSITERTVPELIPVLGSQPTGDVSHKPGGRLPLLSARPAVTPAILKRAATNFAPW